MRSSTISPVSWSISYLLREPLGISTITVSESLDHAAGVYRRYHPGVHMAGTSLHDPIGVGPALREGTAHPRAHAGGGCARHEAPDRPTHRPRDRGLRGAARRRLRPRGAAHLRPVPGPQPRQGARRVRAARRRARGPAASREDSAASSRRSRPRASATTSGSCSFGAPSLVVAAAALRLVARGVAPGPGRDPDDRAACGDRVVARSTPCSSRCVRVEVTVTVDGDRRDVRDGGGRDPVVLGRTTNWCSPSPTAARCRSRSTGRDLGAPGEPGTAMDRHVHVRRTTSHPDATTGSPTP